MPNNDAFDALASYKKQSDFCYMRKNSCQGRLFGLQMPTKWELLSAFDRTRNLVDKMLWIMRMISPMGCSAGINLSFRYLKDNKHMYDDILLLEFQILFSHFAFHVKFCFGWSFLFSIVSSVFGCSLWMIAITLILLLSKKEKDFFNIFPFQKAFEVISNIHPEFVLHTQGLTKKFAKESCLQLC